MTSHACNYYSLALVHDIHNIQQLPISIESKGRHRQAESSCNEYKRTGVNHKTKHKDAIETTHFSTLFQVENIGACFVPSYMDLMYGTDSYV